MDAAERQSARGESRTGQALRPASRRWKLICLDVDGTLLDDQKHIPFEVKASLRRARAQGMEIALVSGRMPAGLELVEWELGIECIKASSAGTYIQHRGQRIAAKYMSAETVEEVWRRIARPLKIPLWIYREEEWFVTGADAYVEREASIIHQRPGILSVEELARRWRKEGTGPNKLLFGADPDRIQAISRQGEREPLPEVQMARSADIYLEVYPRGADKGWALEEICRYLGIRECEAVAFGDQELDIPMIRKAGLGIAMGNAADILKSQADFVTRSNNQAGIAWALAQLMRE